MHMINTSEILETLQMIDHQKLDVRTITMGISLFSCVTDDERKLCDNISTTSSPAARSAWCR